MNQRHLLRRVAAGVGLLCVLVVRVTVMAAAERPAQPSNSSQAKASGQQPSFSLAYIPRDAVSILATRPATLLQKEPLAPLREVLAQFAREALELDVQIEDVSEFTVVLLPPADAAPSVAMIVRTSSAAAAERVAAKLSANAVRREFAGQPYFCLDSRMSFFQPDRQTVVLSPQEPTLVRCLAAGKLGAASTNWVARWATVATQDAAAVVNTALLRGADPSLAADPLGQLYGDRMRRSQAAMQLAYQLSPLWRRAEHVVADLQLDKVITLRIISQSASEDEAREVHSAWLTAISVLRVALSRARAAVVAEPTDAGPSLLQSIDLVDEILEKAQIVRQAATVGVQARAEEAAAQQLTKLVQPAALAARDAGSRTQSLNNLKLIALAFHNYHDTYKTFPAATQIGPKNTPRSWRVTLLPFLEQMQLYELYRQDEPWDSQHNQQVLARMPDVFRCPRDVRGSTKTSYFALVGPETASPTIRAARLADITDGTSNTLLVVESKRETPWTKPEDIPFDATQPPPKLGGWYPQGFCGVMCDGFARFFPDDKTDPQTLQWIIMRSDGHPVRLPP